MTLIQPFLPICPHITLMKVNLDVLVYHHLPHVMKMKLQDQKIAVNHF